MNYHDDQWIMSKLQEHYDEALEHFPEDRIVCLILQGSQNYGLDVENSDIDTKLIVTPTFEDIAMNKKPISTTHIRENDEHIDFKDIRLYIQTFRKQNLNFLEILYSPYKIVNPLYEEQWNRLIEANEDITHYNPFRAIKSMKGIAMEKWHAMEHRYPSKAEFIDKYGFDCKQLHHLLRVEEYIERYINGESYADCLMSKQPEYLKAVKQHGYCTLDEARELGQKALYHILSMHDEFVKQVSDEADLEVDALLDDVQLEIMKIAVKQDIDKW